MGKVAVRMILVVDPASKSGFTGPPHYNPNIGRKGQGKKERKRVGALESVLPVHWLRPRGVHRTYPSDLASRTNMFYSCCTDTYIYGSPTRTGTAIALEKGMEGTC